MKNDEKSVQDRLKERTQIDPKDFGDGRDPLARYATLFRSEKAKELGRRGTETASAFISTMRHSLIDTDLSSLGSNLEYIADIYLRENGFRCLPATEEYRVYATRVGKAARTLLKELKEGEDKSWGLNQGMRRTLKIGLWHNPRDSQQSFESIILAFMTVCDTFSKIETSTASRPREDIRILVGHLAAIWKRLTGRRCPTNLTRNEDKEDSDFQAEGPRFVHAVAQAFDPSITPQQIATALRKRPSARKRVQLSDQPGAASLHKKNFD